MSCEPSVAPLLLITATLASLLLRGVFWILLNYQADKKAQTLHALFFPHLKCTPPLQWEHCTIFSSSLNLTHNLTGKEKRLKVMTHPPTSDADHVYLEDFFPFIKKKKERYFFSQHWPPPPANPRANWLTRSWVESRLFAPLKRSPKTLPALPLFDRAVIVWMHSIHRWDLSLLCRRLATAR